VKGCTVDGNQVTEVLAGKATIALESLREQLRSTVSAKSEGARDALVYEIELDEGTGHLRGTIDPSSLPEQGKELVRFLSQSSKPVKP
jgi:hypothetical protein